MVLLVTTAILCLSAFNSIGLVQAHPAPVFPGDVFDSLITTITAPDTRSGCGKSAPFFPERFITSGGKLRSYSFHVPGNYDEKRRYPVVVGFHGSSQFGGAFAADTGLSSANYTGDKIMIYPDGAGGNWAGPSYAKTSVAADLRFVQDLLDDVKGTFCVDASRIYATGLSNGGGFVGTIMCSAVGGSFAAFAPVAGSFYTDLNGTGCSPARSLMPVLEIHGVDDKTVPYVGGKGEGGQLPPVWQWAQRWGARNRCSNGTASLLKDDVHLTKYVCSNKTEGVLQYKVDGMAHEWPMPWPTLSGIVAGDMNGTAIDANSIIMSFFDKWSL